MFESLPRALLWSAGALLGLVAEWVAYDVADFQRWGPDLLVGWTFIGCGLTVASRGPDIRVGVLMAATGATWFLGNFSSLGVGAIAWTAAHGLYFHRGPLIHLILSYPSGRLRSRPARLVTAAGYGAAVLRPFGDSATATVLLSLVLVIVSGREFSTAVGLVRRARFATVWAAAGLALVLIGDTALRTAFADATVSYPSLLAYEATLVGIAGGLAVGLLMAGWERTDIMDLVVELGSPRTRTLEAELARAVGDPSLRVGYWIADTGSFVDGQGHPLAVLGGSLDRSVTVVGSDSEPVAVILHDPAVLDDARLVEAVAAAAELSAANARLQVELRGRLAEVEASRRRILDARDEEQRRLERRVQEGPERRIAELSRSLHRLRPFAAGAQTVDRITRADDHLRRAIEELHQLARGLAPRVLVEDGLEPAVAALADLCPVPVEVVVSGERMSPPVEAAIYFVCAEGLTNVAKHASASSAAVTVVADGGRAWVRVVDDGVGGAEPPRGSGLRGLADRIAALGGVVSVTSAPGLGTTLAADIPCGGEGRGSRPEGGSADLGPGDR